MSSVSFVLNGKLENYNGSATARLLEILREYFRLTGTKCGCLEGECGACSVIIDGKLTNSCLVAMGSLEGKSVITIEGYKLTDRFKAIDLAFAEFSAVQCGFCTPGMVLATEALLNSNPLPTEAEIREALSGNLCRCTGYNAIVKAVKKVSEEADGLW